jgi:hypothetical protein
MSQLTPPRTVANTDIQIDRACILVRGISANQSFGPTSVKADISRPETHRQARRALSWKRQYGGCYLIRIYKAWLVFAGNQCGHLHRHVARQVHRLGSISPPSSVPIRNLRSRWRRTNSESASDVKNGTKQDLHDGVFEASCPWPASHCYSDICCFGDAFALTTLYSRRNQTNGRRSMNRTQECGPPVSSSASIAFDATPLMSGPSLHA